MRNSSLILLVFIIIPSFFYSQDYKDYNKRVNKEVTEYVSKKIKNYELNIDLYNKHLDYYKKECEEHNIEFNQIKFNKSIDQIKKYELEKEYYCKNPYKKPSSSNNSKNILQLCDNGGFEDNIQVDNLYSFKYAISPSNGQGMTLVTTGADFIPITTPITVDNTNNSLVSLVSPGTVSYPPGSGINRVKTGERSVKLNQVENIAFTVVTMSREFVVNENSFNFNFSLIVNDPYETGSTGHVINEKPFFLVRIYDMNDNILRSVNILTNPNDCVYTSDYIGIESGTALYTDWKCGSIDTSDLINQNVRVEFIISDCAFGQHSGIVYIDDICNSSCSEPLFGSINFNQIDTKICPFTTQTISGFFQAPFDSEYSNMKLNITQNGNIINTINSPTTLTSDSFSFSVPTSAYGINPSGAFEFQVVASFIRNCTINYQLNPIFDNSANDLGDDVVFFDCINAVNDNATIDMCNIQKIKILKNDSVFGNQATSSNVIISQISPIIPELILNTTTGSLIPAEDALSGTYSITYQICSVANPLYCDTATITITIIQAEINAQNDTYNIYIEPCNNTVGITDSVIINDTLCQTNINSSSNVSITLIDNGGIIGAVINDDGIITIPVSTLPNSYTLQYQICQNTSPNNCDIANVNINVTNTTLNAVNDNFSFTPINTLIGGTTSTVFVNDLLLGVPVVSTNITPNIVSISPPITGLPVIINTNGTITFPQGVPIGTYTLVYKITENTCSSNSDTATVIITISETQINTPELTPGIRANSAVTSIDTQSDSKIIITGHFTTYNNIPTQGIARLNTDLTLDNSTNFNVSGSIPAGYPARENKVIKNYGANYNKIIIVGEFYGYNGGSNGKGIARLMPNGNIDTSFNSAYTNTDKGVSGFNNQIRTCYIYPDNAINGNAGKILIGGAFEKYNGQLSRCLARLNADGSLDQTFSNNIMTMLTTTGDPNPGFTSAVQAIEVQSDGKILVGGYFNYYNGLTVNKIVRLNNDGTFDTTFNSAYFGFNKAVIGHHIRKFLLQPDGKIIICGFFSKYNNVTRNNIARLHGGNATNAGTLDTTFNPGTGFFPVFTTNTSYDTEPDGMVRDIVFEQGTPLRFYASGPFTKYNNVNVQKVIRINSSQTGTTGSRDTGFTFGTLSTHGPNGNVWAMKRQGDNKLILGGKFNFFVNNLGSTPASNITRVLPATPLTNEAKGINYYTTDPEIDLINIIDSDIIVFPNPSNGIFTIDANNLTLKNSTFTMYSTLGVKVFEELILNSKIKEFNLSHLQKGTYFVVLTTQETTIKKTIIIN